MGYEVLKDKFIKNLPREIKSEFIFLKKFDDSFFGDSKPLTKNRIYSAKVAESNIKYLDKSLNYVKSGKNIDFTVQEYKFRFIISGKRAARKGDATSTRLQELCSLAICRNVFQNKPTELTELVKTYPELTDRPDWVESFKAQEVVFKTIKQKYNLKPTVFNRDKGFMEFISKLVKQFGVSAKDSWNPADIWIHTNNIEKEFKNVSSLKEINDIMIRLFNEGSLCGISLKKTGKIAKYEETNFKKIIMKNNGFIKGKLLLDLKPGGLEFTNDEFSYDLQHPEGIINVQYRMYPKGNRASNQVSYKLKGGKAEMGKVPAAFRNVIYKEITGADFPKGRDMPYNRELFLKEKDKWELKIKRILQNNKFELNITNAKTFSKNIMNIYDKNDDKYHSIELVSKFQGIEVAYQFSKLSSDKLDKLVTNWSYLAQKKSANFGPFLKVY